MPAALVSVENSVRRRVESMGSSMAARARASVVQSSDTASVRRSYVHFCILHSLSRPLTTAIGAADRRPGRPHDRDRAGRDRRCDRGRAGRSPSHDRPPIASRRAPGDPIHRSRVRRRGGRCARPGGSPSAAAAGPEAHPDTTHGMRRAAACGQAARRDRNGPAPRLRSRQGRGRRQARICSFLPPQASGAKTTPPWPGPKTPTASPLPGYRWPLQGTGQTTEQDTAGRPEGPGRTSIRLRIRDIRFPVRRTCRSHGRGPTSREWRGHDSRRVFRSRS